MIARGCTRLGVTGFGGPPAHIAWTAFKVGALAFGGGFVIIPLVLAALTGALGVLAGLPVH